MDTWALAADDDDDDDDTTTTMTMTTPAYPLWASLAINFVPIFFKTWPII
jgi:hypothetical protein